MNHSAIYPSLAIAFSSASPRSAIMPWVAISQLIFALCALPGCAVTPTTAPQAPPRVAPASAAIAPAGPVSDRVPSPCVAVDKPYVGTICTPSGAASIRHPAIVVFGGYGDNGEGRRLALELSGRGYVTAGVSYFGVPGTPRTLVDVPVEIGVAAVTALAARPDVDPRRLAVIGTSKGGEYALLVATATPAVKAVIANVPSPFAWHGLGLHGTPTGCSWSQSGRTLPCVPPDVVAGQEAWQTIRAGHPVGFRIAYEAARRNTASVERALFPLERIAGPVLCLAAGDDQVWNSSARCDLALDYLRAHRHAFADRAVTFPGAGHLYLMARSGPSAALNTAPMGGGGRMVFGGTPEADANAATAAVKIIDDFLSNLATDR